MGSEAIFILMKNQYESTHFFSLVSASHQVISLTMKLSIYQLIYVASLIHGHELWLVTEIMIVFTNSPNEVFPAGLSGRERG